MNIDQEMHAALNTFTVESLELLSEMEENLLGLEGGENSAERVNAIFRAVHTIKGSAGLFSLNHIVAFTHVVESVLDRARDGTQVISSKLVAALLPCCDHIGLLIRGVIDGYDSEDPEFAAAGEVLLKELQLFLTAETDKDFSLYSANQNRLEAINASEMVDDNWGIFLKFGEDSLRNGMDPLSFIRYLSTFGEFVELKTCCGNMPEAQSMDPESSYLSFNLIFKSDASKESIENVFEFVRDSSQIHIVPLKKRIPYYLELIGSLEEEQVYLGQLLLKCGVITQHELDEGLQMQRQQSDNRKIGQVARLGEIMVERHTVPQNIVDAALEKQKSLKESKTIETQNIRVDAERLDKLIDLIGELVIAGAGVNLRAPMFGDGTLLELTGDVMQLIEAVRDSALQLRMVPVGSTFGRFQRVVRDVSKELGKDIALIISGGETEVDKSIVEKIADPLLHLVRNAIDHGIEDEETRVAHGKPRRGTLKLNAYHASGCIVIEVSDDGGGLNRERIMEKAIERSLISVDANLPDQDVYALIFEPGFSTAQQVSNLSGRGVGMDVVRRNVTALRGSIKVDSQAGKGTTMRIFLPLTLAIIDGFLVGIGTATFVVPLDRILECVTLAEDARDRDYMDLRGEVLPLIRLRQLFDVCGNVARRENVVVVEHAGSKTGIVVDQLLGEFQTVIKPLSKLFVHIKGVAGTTILGNGKVALILDVTSLVELAERKCKPQLKQSVQITG